jgi:hypothetical protein
MFQLLQSPFVDSFKLIFGKTPKEVIYQWNFSEIEVYFLPPLPLRRRGIIPLLRRG